MVSVRDFHSSFLLYCVRNKFASLMYHYLDYYRYMFEGGEGGREGGKEGGREGGGKKEDNRGVRTNRRIIWK